MTVAPPQLGQVYRCSVCGAEVTLIRPGGAAPVPYCCNRPMDCLADPAPIFRCPICGAEIAVIRQGDGNLTPYCCNRLMLRRN